MLALARPSAGAITPPEVDAAVAPPPGSAGPVQPMAQRSECTASGVVPGSDPGTGSPNQLSLNLSEAWRHSRGEGQLVAVRSEEHTSELQSLMRNSYAVFCLKKKI